MKTPFVYFGKKERIAREVWQRFGDPKYYYEPFAGGLGCLLNRPSSGKYEYVNDNYCLLTNFWRAAKYAAPDEMVKWVGPPNQIDLIARLNWLQQQTNRLHLNMVADPLWHDVQAAVWYAWVNSNRISKSGTALAISRGAGLARWGMDHLQYFTDLKERLKNTVVYFGDWSTLANAALGVSRNDGAILLDPCYPFPNGRQKMYEGNDPEVAAECSEFALAAASPKLKIALCGYDGDYDMPDNWECLAWKSQWANGFERVWFSPHCLK